MNCHELTTTLKGTLLRQRSPQWYQEACLHAKHCPACAQLLTLQQLEEDLTELPAVGTSDDFVRTVMSRLTRQEPVTALASQSCWLETVKYAMVAVGALTLAATYVFPAAGESWLSHLWSHDLWLTDHWPSLSHIPAVESLTYFTHHPPWAALLAGSAALLLVLGLATEGRASGAA